MPLCSALDILPTARAGGYAVGAFSIHTPEMVEACCTAAVRQHAPIILQVGRRAVRQAGLAACCAWVRAAAATCPVPVCLHLDHAQSFEAIVAGLRAGVTSAMYDGSDLPPDENARTTAEVVRVCHAAGVPVEAEVGRIGGVEDDIHASAALAAAADCAGFVARTGCDVLAPAIGSAHGLGATVPQLRLDLLAEIAAAVPLPLVLHGGSGLDLGQVRQAIASGIAKVNVDTELRRAFITALRPALERFAAADDIQPALADATAALTELVESRIIAFGGAGRA